LPKGIRPMKSGKMLKSFATSLSLLIGVGLLQGCAGIKVKVDSTCSWAEPINVTDEVIDYLESNDSPEGAIALMNEIADHNELYSKYC